MAEERRGWTRCSNDGCIGVRLPTTTQCLHHAVEQAPDAFDDELKRIGNEGTIDARGTRINSRLLRSILGAAPRKRGRVMLGAAAFDLATFEDEAEFSMAVFLGEARFLGATFKGAPNFNFAIFQDRAVFGTVTFEKGASFGYAAFQDSAGFSGAMFKGPAGFDGATFEGEARFRGVTFERGASFEQASFQRSAGFVIATFRGQDQVGFGETTFHAEARFGGATFEGEAWFGRAEFVGEARFSKAIFQQATGFDRATFQAEAQFDGAIFQREAWFQEVTFKHEAVFDSGTFKHEAAFDGATFGREARFGGTAFEGEARFDAATFERAAGFDGAVFHAEAEFDRTTFKREAGFDKTIFRQASRIGPLLAGRLFLDGAVFTENVEIDAATAVLCARRAQFPAGVRLHLRWASVVLDDANLTAPSILAGVPPFSNLNESDVARRWQRLPPGPRAERSQPRLISIRRADVAGLRVANVDLQACQFAAAHNLDKLRIEGESLFAPSPGWWRAHRKTLAEEQQWRASRTRRWRPGGWYPKACQPPTYKALPPTPALPPVQLAALYRELRKGREDAKDEPGAADFYYGEMEMRRLNPTAPWAERLVLWLYWLSSGYALRAWRALASLAVVVLLASVLFAFWGFPESEPGFRPVGTDPNGALIYRPEPADPPPGLGRLPESVRFSARSATALLRGPDRRLTPVGEWLEIGLRFAGPVLLGLAVLSIRGRVRR
jgi:uncharacterized protein YjbI with pentapeptide repeats